MKDKLNTKALANGLATMLGSMFLISFGMVILPLFLPTSVLNLMGGEEWRNNMFHFLFVAGVISDVAGGFVTGWTAKYDRVQNAFALAILYLILGEALELFSGAGFTLLEIAGKMVIVLATVLGGYLSILAFDRVTPS